MAQSIAWDGILQEGEEILWQGQPEPGIAWGDLLSPITAFGVVFGGFALFWIAGASYAVGGDAPGFPLNLFPLFGLPFLLVGIYLALGRVFWDAYVRSDTWYTLTDSTAFVASAPLGKKRLKTYPIADMPILELVLEDGQQGTVLFAEIHRQNGDDGDFQNPGSRGRGTTVTRIGFHRIAEAGRVYGLIREARGALTSGNRRARDHA